MLKKENVRKITEKENDAIIIASYGNFLNWYQHTKLT